MANDKSTPRPGFGELKTLWRQAAQAREQAGREAAQRQAAHAAQRNAAPTLTKTASAEDAQLFRRAMQAVTPLATEHTPRPGSTTALAAPSPEQLAKRKRALGLSKTDAPDAPAALSDNYVPQFTRYPATEPGLAWHAPDIAADTLARLQRGQWRVTARLDLHGLRTDAARMALTAFIADCMLHRVRCVRIIHGLGHSSAAPPVLKEKTPAWLAQHPDVCAFVQAPAAEGGAGAVLVLLRTGHKES